MGRSQASATEPKDFLGVGHLDAPLGCWPKAKGYPSTQGVNYPLLGLDDCSLGVKPFENGFAAFYRGFNVPQVVLPTGEAVVEEGDRRLQLDDPLEILWV